MAALAAVPTWDEWKRLTGGIKKPQTGLFHVFLVREVQLGFARHDNINGITQGDECIIEDGQGGLDGSTLAHEVGHYLLTKSGIQGSQHRRNRRYLMYAYSKKQAKRLTKADVQNMNPDLVLVAAKPGRKSGTESPSVFVSSAVGMD